MSKIDSYLQKILSARYGKDVRQSIHDAIKIEADLAEKASTDSAEAKSVAITSQTSAYNSAEIARQYAELSKGETAIASMESFELETAEGGIRVEKIVGKSVKSANLFDENSHLFVSRGIVRGTGTYLNNGKVTITPTNGSNKWAYVQHRFKLPIGTYTISYDADTTFTRLQIVSVLGSTLSTIINDSGKSHYDVTFSINSDFDAVQINIGTSDSSVVGTTYTFSNIRLVEGSTALPYMPYGILSSGSENGISLNDYSKNLFGDKNPFFNVKGIVRGTGTYLDGGKVTITPNNASNLNGYVMHQFENLPNGTYTFSCDSDDTSTVIQIIGMVDTSTFTTITNSSGKTHYEIQFTLDGTYKYLRINIGTQNASTTTVGKTYTFSNIMLERNSSASEYVGADGVISLIPLTEPLRNLGDVKDEIDVENKRIIRRIGYDVYDGTETWNMNTTYAPDYRFSVIAKKTIDVYQRTNMLNNYGIYSSSVGQNNIWINTSNNGVYIFRNDITTLADWKTYLSTHNMLFQYVLATPIYEPLTSEQIKVLHSLKSYEEKTYIDSADLYAKPTLDLEYATHRVGALTLQNYNENHINSANLEEQIVNLQAMVLELETES